MFKLKHTLLLLLVLYLSANVFSQTYQELKDKKEMEYYQKAGEINPRDNKAYPVHATLGGDNVLGALKIDICGPTLQIYRNIGTSPANWQFQWYESTYSTKPARSTHLYIGSSGAEYYGGTTTATYVEGVAATYVPDYFMGTSEYNRIDIHKVDNYTATVTMTRTGVVEVKLTIYYPKNSDYISYVWDIKNLHATNTYSNLRFFAGGDTYSYGDDFGIGTWAAYPTATPPNWIVGCTKDDNGTPINIFIQTMQEPFQHESAFYDDVRTHIQNNALTGTVTTTTHDNAVGLEWRKGTLTPGETWTIGTYEKYSDKVVSNLEVEAPLNQTIAAGETKTINFTVINKSAGAISNISLASLIDLAGWTATITSPVGTFNLAAGAQQTVAVQIYCPASATQGQVAQNTVTATSGATSANDVAYIQVVGTVPTPPVITTQPTDVTVCPGSPTSFTVVATGATSYQWQINSAGWVNLSNGGVYTNVTAATLNISNVTGLFGTQYRCNVINGTGTTTSSIVTIIDKTPVAPTSVAASPTSVSPGGSSTLTYTGGSGTTFGWYTGSCGGTPVGTGNNFVVTPGATTTYYGRWENSCGNTTCQSVTVTYVPGTYNINGTLKYGKSTGTGISGMTVTLTPGPITTKTDATGNFQFSNVVNNTYTITPTISLPYSGLTSMDITLYKKHLAGTTILSGMPLIAGDVNGGGLSVSDATPMLQRITTQISSFPAITDWVLSSPLTVTVSGAAASIDVLAICAADANCSYSFAKSTLSGIPAVNEETLYFADGQYFEIPVKAKTDIKGLCSITLDFPYNNAMMNVTGIAMAKDNDAMQYTIIDGNIKIAYSNLTAHNFMSGDVIFYIRGYVNKITDNPNFINEMTGEFGNSNDEVINEVMLSVPYIAPKATTGIDNIDLPVEIYPNPVKDQLYIRNANNSVVELCDMYGSILRKQNINDNITLVETQNLASGTYFVKVQKNSQVIVRRIIIVK